MKKLFFVITLFCLLLNTFTVFAQSCDCETLQTQIDDLNKRLELLQSFTTKDIEPTDYHQQIYIDKDYRIRFFGDFSNITIKNVNYNTTSGGTIDHNSFQITFFFDNLSPFDTKFNEKIFIRAYQIEKRLQKDFKNTKDSKITPSYITEPITIAFLLDDEINDVTMEICEILQDNKLNHVATWVIPLSDAVRE